MQCDSSLLLAKMHHSAARPERVSFIPFVSSIKQKRKRTCIMPICNIYYASQTMRKQSKFSVTYQQLRRSLCIVPIMVFVGNVSHAIPSLGHFHALLVMFLNWPLLICLNTFHDTISAIVRPQRASFPRKSRRTRWARWCGANNRAPVADIDERTL
jgi:hypothetical protein